MKPSPVASIVLFVGALCLLIATFSGSWFSVSFGDGDSASFGLIWGRTCYRGDCNTQTIFSGGLGAGSLVSVLLFLLCLAGAVLAAIAGLILLKPGRTALAIVALSLVSAALLLVVVRSVLFGGGFGSNGYAFYVFVLGALGTIAGCIVAMSRPRPVVPMRQVPMYPGMQPGMYQQPPNPGYQQQPMQPPMMQQPMYAQGAPCPTCVTPTTWVAQYNRWFCTRCNSYP